MNHPEDQPEKLLPVGGSGFNWRTDRKAPRSKLEVIMSGAMLAAVAGLVVVGCVVLMIKLIQLV